MRFTRFLWFIAILFLPVVGFGQAPAIITMDQEPHHHLSLKNDYVKVFKVEVAPGDSILMHSHDQDTIAIAVGDQMVTVGFPDKPDVHQKNPDGQLRLQKTGYVHSTKVDPGTTYHTVAVELLRPQGNPRNLCAAVMAGQPLNCPERPDGASSKKYIAQPQFESDQTRVQVVRVLPGQNATIGNSKFFQLVVALDPASISPASGKGPEQMLHSGDFVWFEKGGASRVFKNSGKSEARFVEFAFDPIDPKGKLIGAPGALQAPRRLTAERRSDQPLVPGGPVFGARGGE
jgi:quercetin dioxygenase-like cupin family protein